MTVNQELFNKIADVIEMEPDAYNQHEWAMLPKSVDQDDDIIVYIDDADDAREAVDALGTLCGTRCCIAGWAVTLSAAERGLITPTFNENTGVTLYGEQTRVNPIRWLQTLAEQTAGSQQPDQAGAKLLGISTDEAAHLFRCDWRPQTSLSVPEALRKIGEGHSVYDV